MTAWELAKPALILAVPFPLSPDGSCSLVNGRVGFGESGVDHRPAPIMGECKRSDAGRRGGHVAS
jgi:hypothetical protein